MSKYQLKPDEYVVMKSENVRHGGMMATYSDDLVLTNKNVILVSKGVLGNTKGVDYFPLSSIKNIDDKPQAIASGLELEIYFLDRHDSFQFRSKREVRTWATNVARLLMGDADDIKSANDMSIPGAAYVVETLRDTVDTVKQSFGLKARKPKREKTAAECRSCGASMSGTAGKVVRCHFCNSDQKL